MDEQSERTLRHLRQSVECIDPKYRDMQSQLSGCLKAELPFHAITLSRVTAEALVKDLLSNLGHRPPDQFAFCIRRLRVPRINRGFVPRAIPNALEHIRRWGNQAAHDRDKHLLTWADVAGVLQRLLHVVDWYYMSFAKGPRERSFYGGGLPTSSPAILPEDEMPLPAFFSGGFTSRFAGTEKELETVLELRRAFFGDKVIVPDDSYRRCWERNPDTMKLVHDHAGRAIGYWSVIPVSAGSFEAFLLGRISHKEMLTGHCLAWSSTHPGDTYLYVVGAVVPSKGTPHASILPGILSSRVLLDLFGFAITLTKHVRVKGVCGYPSKTGGRQILHKLGFAESGLFVGGDSRQPICYYKEAEMGRLDDKLQQFLLSQADVPPHWIGEDRERFVQNLTGPAAPRVR